MTAPTVFAPEGPWLFSKRDDLLAFGGSTLLAFGLLALGLALGIAESDAPDWIWISCILFVDVAHVWSTIYRVYLDGAEVRRRPLLYVGAPVLCYGAGVLLHSFDSHLFWSVLAYVAVFHFVRQQNGWVALYARRERGSDLDRRLDALTTYAATLGPLVWWHGHLPRRFHWFVEGDFVTGLAAGVTDVAMPFYWALLALWLVRQVWRSRSDTPPSAGKVLVVASTWACWYVGIVALDGDFAFTVTNVLIHGVPYLWLTYRYGRTRTAAPVVMRLLRGGVPIFLLSIVVLAIAEEAAWAHLVWHDRGWLFGEGVTLSRVALSLVVPLLVLPQLVHYVLDGFIWRRGSNPQLV